DGLLELAPRGELRDRGGRDRHLLRRIAGIHALALCAPLRRELSEACEGHFSPALQRVGDRVEEGVNSLCCIPAREVGPLRNLINELLFRQVLSSCRRFEPRAKTLTVAEDWLNHAVLRHFLWHFGRRSHGKAAAAAPFCAPEPRLRPPRGRPRRLPCVPSGRLPAARPRHRPAL